MSQVNAVVVGNEFVLPQPRLPVAAPSAKLKPVEEETVPVIPVEAVSQLEIVPVTVTKVHSLSPLAMVWEQMHRHSFIVFALLFLLVASSGIEVGASYWAARLTVPAVAASVKKPVIAGLNLTIPATELQSKLQSITSQPANLTVGSQTIAISPNTIKSWLKITPNKAKSEDYIHINTPAMTKSLNDMASGFESTPVNQVTITHGSVSQIVVAGHNGAKLTDPGTLATQVNSVAKSVMDGKGLNFNTPLASLAFQAVTPASFNKLIEVNVDTHQMYLYDNGNLTSTYAVSAGAPATPTPIGEFHIWEKLPVQTMKGFNPNGTPYVQPNVPWINYFDHNGDAVHGNYWRPASVFGAVNTSHGCVSLPVSQAEQVYNWTTIGTAVITHH